MILEKSIGSLVTQNPGWSRTFERLGIDYCCQGKLTLSEACTKKGLDVSKVIQELNNERAEIPAQANWANSSLTELCDHIQNTHHAYLKNELPRIEKLALKVAARHGDADPRLRQIATILSAFITDLSAHMQKEEMILFPLIRTMEQGADSYNPHCGSIKNPISVMEAEHAEAGSHLEVMRIMSDGYTPPDWACPTYRALLDGLRELEIDMHKHVHKENSILFPRAIALEKKFIC